jgi:hypothetical protein
MEDHVPETLPDTPLLPETPEARAAREKREAARRSREWRDRVRLNATVDRALVDAFVVLQEDLGSTPQAPAPLTFRDVLRAGKAKLVEAGLAPADATAAIVRRIRPEQPDTVPGPA